MSKKNKLLTEENQHPEGLGWKNSRAYHDGSKMIISYDGKSDVVEVLKISPLGKTKKEVKKLSPVEYLKTGIFCKDDFFLDN